MGIVTPTRPGLISARLKALVAPDRTVHAHYTCTTNYSIANNSNIVVDFDTRVRDTHLAVSGSGVAWRFTAPYTKVYVLGLHILYSGSTAWGLGEYSQCSVVLDSGAYYYVDRKDDIDSSGTSQMMNHPGCIPIFIEKGDKLSVVLRQTSGAARTLHNDPTFNWVSIMGIAERY